MNRPLWNTRNDLAEQVRTGSVELLNQQLADALKKAPTSHDFRERSPR